MLNFVEVSMLMKFNVRLSTEKGESPSNQDQVKHNMYSVRSQILGC